MGITESLDDCQLKFVVNEYYETKTKLIAETVQGDTINIILLKDHPNYNTYIKYVRDQWWIRGEYKVYINSNYIISDLYPSPRFDIIKSDKIIDNAFKDMNMLIDSNDKVYYFNKDLNIDTTSQCKVNYDFKNKKRFIHTVKKI